MKLSDVFPTSLYKVVDTISIGTLLGTLAGWLPNIAAFLTIVWTLIRISETQTYTKFIQWLRNKFYD